MQVPFYVPQLLAGIPDVCLRRGKSRDVKERFACANRSFSARIPYLRGFLMFACAAASLAIGTRNGEQET